MRRLSCLLPFLASGLVLLVLLGLANHRLGDAISPPPLDVLATLGLLGVNGELVNELAVTVGRALLGILLANVVGIVLGLLAGLLPWALRLISPLTAAIQSCPPVVWISLVMVWAGTGGVVPVATVFAATFPFVFSAVAQGVLGLDRGVLAMSKVYTVPRRRVLLRYILPAILPYWLSSFSTVLATGWKSAAVAEFLGSHEGVGARLFWAFRRLDMESFYAWALALVVFGVVLETCLVLPLRRKTASLAERGRDAAA